MSSQYPTSLDAFNNPAGTTLLADPSYLHNQEHGDANDAIAALEAKMGLGAGTPKVDLALIGSGNGTAVWGSVWNNATLGTPSITGGTITNTTLVGISGVTKPFITVGTSNADYITDGTADEVQIQAAIDAVNASGGGIVFMMAGTYQITGTNLTNTLIGTSHCNYSGITLKDKVSIIGAGEGATVFNTSTLGPVFQGTTVTYSTFVNDTAGIGNITLRDFTVIEPVGSGTLVGNGIYTRGVSHFTLQNLYMQNCGFNLYGSTYSWGTATKVLTTDNHDVLIDNVYVDTMYGSTFLIEIKNFVVQNCVFNDTIDDNVLIAVAAQHGKLVNNIFQNTTGVGSRNGGIYILNDTALTSDMEAISDIEITNNSFKGLVSSTSASYAIRLNTCRNIRIHDNYINGCQGGISSTFFSTDYQEDIDIIGNTICNSVGTVGINCNITTNADQRHYNWKIIGNTIYNNIYAGIYLGCTITSGVANFQILNNNIYDDQGTATQDYGIWAQFGVNFDGLQIIGNNLHGAGTELFYNPYAGTPSNVSIQHNLRSGTSV